MEEINLTGVEDGYYRIKSNGANLHLWVMDGEITEVSVHNKTPTVNIFTGCKMSKRTIKLGPYMNNCIEMVVKE